MDLGWERPPPGWLEAICPEVVQHYREFPSFKVAPGAELPVASSEYSTRSACTMAVVQSIGVAAGAHVYLHAGAHLGAVLHGQQMPLDDDVDAMIPFEKRDAFLSECERVDALHATVSVHCYKAWNAIKVHIRSPDMGDGKPITSENGKWRKTMCWSPYMDVFVHKTDGAHINEVHPNGDRGDRPAYAV